MKNAKIEKARHSDRDSNRANEKLQVAVLAREIKMNYMATIDKPYLTDSECIAKARTILGLE